MDPACGSGHILVEVIRFLRHLLEQGYQLREIPQFILEKNLFGLDIDQRAVQLTTFALMMMGRSDDRRLFDRDLKINAIELQDSSDFDVIGLSKRINLAEHGLQLDDLTKLKTLFEHAKTWFINTGLSEACRQGSNAEKAKRGGQQGFLISEEGRRLFTLSQQAESRNAMMQ